jgi:hypothetical protein
MSKVNEKSVSISFIKTKLQEKENNLSRIINTSGLEVDVESYKTNDSSLTSSRYKKFCQR